METTKLIFPIWMMFISPVSWAAIIPGTFLIAFAGLLASLFILHKAGADGAALPAGERFFAAWADTKKAVWRAWLALCLAYVVGTAFMLLPSLASVGLPETNFFARMASALIENIYKNPLAVLWACASVTLSAFLVYLLGRIWTYRKASISTADRVRAAMWAAVFTAPYLFLSTYPLYY